MTTLKKVSTRLTPELAAVIVEMKCVVRMAETAEGVEIRDTRPLIERIENPIGGNGVKRHFGNTHFIVSETLARKLDAKPLTQLVH